MAIISPTTQLQLISKLSPLTTVSSGDLHVIQRDLKTYKISNANYIDSIIDSDIFEQVSDSITIKDNGVGVSKLESIPTNRLLGRTSASNGEVEQVEVAEILFSLDGTHDRIPTELAVTNYVDSSNDEIIYTLLAPYYTCVIHTSNGLTHPNDFTGAVLATFKIPSYGSLMLDSNHTYASNNSMLFTMTVDAENVDNNDTVIEIKLFAVDDALNIYLNGGLILTKGIVANANAPESGSITLTSGINTIEIVKNDGGGNNTLQLVCDIISDGVTFVAPA
jgi:hypothetical protein